MSADFTFDSWDSLVSGNDSSDVGADNRTATLTQDIDLNDEHPLGVSTLVLKILNSNRTYTIDGQGHEIRNLRTLISNPSPIIKNNKDTHLVIKNVDFVNLILGGAPFAYEYRNEYGRANLRITFENCRFVGCRTGNAYFIDSERKITFTSCYFDMPWYAANALDTSYTSLIPKISAVISDTDKVRNAYYCWFHETYGGWTVTDRDGDYNRLQTYPCSCSEFNLHGCYVDGRMKYPQGNINGYIKMYPNIMNPYRQYTASVPNVIDMSFFTSGDNSVQDVIIPKISGVFKKYPINPSARFFVNSDDTSGRPDPILATPAQMQDPSWLQSQGFPIIVPTT